MNNGSELTVQYVDKIFDILETLAAAPSPMGLNELSVTTGINKTTVYRILTALQRRHYVRQTPRQQYTNGPNWHRFGVTPRGTDSQISRVRNLLKDLRDAEGETVHLTVYQSGGRAVYIDVMESLLPLRTSSRVGAISPAYCVSTGKVLLAYQSLEEIESVCQSLTGYTEFTITDPQRLKNHLQAVRRNGFAVNTQEYQKEVCGIAVPIFSPYGEVIAAVGYCVPALRFSDNRVSTLLEALRHHLKEFLGPSAPSTHAL